MSTQATAAVTLDGYNPMLPEVRANPYPYYALMGREDPIHQIVPGMPFLMASKICASVACA